MRVERSAARRRLTRVRWSITVAFALTTALGLILLSAVTLHQDQLSRQRAAEVSLGSQLGALERSVRLEADGSLDLTAFERAVDRDRPERWAVLSRGLLLVSGPDQASLPPDAELARIVAAADFRMEQPVFTAPDTRGTAVLWTDAPVYPEPGIDPAPDSVVLVGMVLPRAQEHRDLTVALLLAVLALTAGTAVAGHLISGRAMRPAIRGLEQQEQFLIEAAHELRTPVSTLRLLLEAEIPDRADRDAERRQVQRLQRLLESLLLRARAEIDDAAVELTPLRLDQLVEQVVEELASSRIRTALEPAVVRGAPQILALAVRNLLENAVRYGGFEPVEVVVADGLLSVADHGPGIPVRDRATVLRPGVSEHGSTGRGLALVAWAARVHRARLTLDDTEGGGLTARMRFATSSSPHAR